MTKSEKTDLGSSMPDDVLRRIGEVTVEWTKLDYVLRVVCKRLEKIPLASERGQEILNLRNHGKVIEAIKGVLNKNGPNNANEIREVIERIGAGRRNGKLYGKRNEIIHSLFYSTNDGETFHTRVGESGDRPGPVKPSDIDALVSELRKTWERLLELVPAGSGDNVTGTEVSLSPSLSRSPT